MPKKICLCIDERGSALERSKGSGRPKSVRTPTNGLSRKWSYAGEIPQSATKAKKDKRIEGRMEVDVGRFTSEAHRQRHQNFTKRLKTCVDTGGGHVNSNNYYERIIKSV